MKVHATPLLSESLDEPSAFETLAGAGILRSQRGRAGGFTLGRDPGDIRLGDVLDGEKSG